MTRQMERFLRSLSGVGLSLGVFFFAAALTPTLVPRTYVTQGLLAGAAFAAGYAIGVGWRWLWLYMELPTVRESVRQKLNLTTILAATFFAAWFLWRAAEWQNSIRNLMGMPPLETAHPFLVSLLAICTFILLLGLGRGFHFLASWAARFSGHYIPRRVANVLGITVAVIIFWLFASDVVWRLGFNALDASFREFDALMEPERPQPTDPLKTGSPASRLSWKSLGRAGREFVASGPGAEEISAFSGRPALEPIRVYVGLQIGDTERERAALALEELQRVDAFERSVLVVAMPTGTGWLDPAAMDSLEYLHHGDVATVALQYSYLSSPLALIVEPDRGSAAADAILAAIYNYWTTLPRESRPRLYLHGLSLGALNSESSVDLFEILGDPINGALWSGPPFANPLWRSFTANRNPGTTAWLPEYRDGSTVRFMNQYGYPEGAEFAPWGAMRIVYLQYASDSVSFFSPLGFYREPAWMKDPRGPDISPELRWYPVVTMLQLLVDMAFATTTPLGYGHLYAPEHYVAAWHEVTEPPGWSEAELERLKLYLRSAMEAAVDSVQGKEDPYGNRGG
jgi:uncharacterized membrane protein